jgi:hypothetical protein
MHKSAEYGSLFRPTATGFFDDFDRTDLSCRGLLGWSQTQWAKAAERSLPTIKRLERDDGEGPSVSDDVRDAVQRALEKAGVEFIAENGGGAGVRMKKRKR